MNLKWLTALIFIILAYMLGFLIMFDRPVPYERLPAWSPAELKVVKGLMKQHGIATVIRSEAGAYFVRDGQRIWLSKRE
jgi:hypothetical protein